MVRIHPGQLPSSGPALRGSCFLLALLLGSSGALVAGVGPLTALQAPPDSTALLGRAREAQSRFEGTRIASLPLHRSLASQPCHYEIGRICVYFPPGGEEEAPEPEPETLPKARVALIDTLAAFAGALPGDEWIHGQWIHYLAEAGRWDEAEEVARSCVGAQPAWCQALLGFVLHGRGRALAAERAFIAALAALPEGEASAWRSFDEIVPFEVRRGLNQGAGEAEHDLRSARFWTLADPLYSLAGNERWTGHLARRVEARIRARARTPFGYSWGSDLEEVLLRFGWESGWTRVWPDEWNAGPEVVGYHFPGQRGFLPPVAAILAWEAARAPPGPLAWDSIAPASLRPWSAFAPAPSLRVDPGEAQIALLPRGDSTIVVAALAYEPPEDDGLNGRSPGEGADTSGPRLWGLDSAAFSFGPPPVSSGGETPEDLRMGLYLVDERGETLRFDSIGIAGRERGGGPATQVFSVGIPPGRWVASAEAVTLAWRHARRARRLVRTKRAGEGTATLSDLLLLDSGGAAGLREALPLLRPSASVGVGDSLVLAWEIDRAPPGHADFTLSVERMDRSFLSRLGAWLGIGSRTGILRLEWSEATPAGIGASEGGGAGPWFRAIAVGVPEPEPGPYRVRLEVVFPGHLPLVAERVVRIG